MYKPLKILADVIRWTLDLGIWAFVTYLLWGIWWLWAIIWVVPGYFLVVAIVGFVTLPLYVLIGLANPALKEMKRLNAMFKQPDERSKPPDSD